MMQRVNTQVVTEITVLGCTLEFIGEISLILEHF